MCTAGKKKKNDEKKVFTVLAAMVRTDGTFNKMKKYERQSSNVGYDRLFNNYNIYMLRLFRRSSIFK